MKDGKINPVHLMKKEDGDRPGFYIVDGLSTYTVCESTGINSLNAILHPWNDDPSDMMIDLNTDNHRSSKELYLMAENCYKKLSLGQGSRTDLSGKVKEDDIYLRIAKRLNVKSGSMIRSFLRIGRTQESYFIDIDRGVTSPDYAYRACVAIEKKRKGDNVDQNGYVSTSTTAPDFTEGDNTDDTDPAVEFEYKDGLSKNVKSVLKKIEKMPENEIRTLFNHLSVSADVCICCGKKINHDGEGDVIS
jgi:hypothetical protein